MEGSSKSQMCVLTKITLAAVLNIDRLWDKEGSKETNLEDFCKIVLVACVRKMGRLRLVHLLRSTRRT